MIFPGETLPSGNNKHVSQIEHEHVEAKGDADDDAGKHKDEDENEGRRCKMVVYKHEL